MNVRVPDLQPSTVADAVKANRHFAAVLVVLLAILVASPGSPARSLIDDIVSSGPPATTVPVAAGAPATTPSAPTFGPFAPPAVSLTETTPPAPASPPLVDPATLPPAEPLAPPPVCATDAVADVLDQVRGSLSDVLGLQVPGASLRKLAAISTGCSTADPTTAVLDLALELAAFVPPTGLDQIDLPDLPGIDVPVAPELFALLEPLAPAIREGCANLATVAVLFVVLPPAFNLPFSQSDLVQFLGPATTVCALFDEKAP